MRRRARFAAAALAAVVFAGCAEQVEPAPPEPELRGRVRQSNLDQSLTQFRVQVLNEGNEPVDVRDLVLHVPPFPDAASEVDATIRPERRIDFPVVYGEPTCTGPSPTPEPARADAVAEGQPVEIVVDDSQDVLRRLLTLFCNRRRLAEVVTATLGEQWRPDPAGDALLGTIELRRSGGNADVSVHHLTGSVVFRLEPAQATEPIAVLEGDQDTLSVPVRAVALRCDPHALAEGKKNYVFSVWLGLAGGPQEVKVELAADVRTRPTFDTLCTAWASPGVEP
jgi:hypothetical protein